ncbi:MAG TPA: glycosyltransferase family 4 protein [Capsulimonadaceae bacterium]|jgi:glycosyltransferase involved in cell wall biosynthesis
MHARNICPDAKIIVETEQNIYRRLPVPFSAIQTYSLTHCDFVVGRSREAIEVVRRKGYAGDARVVPNAVDCELFYPLPSGSRASLRSEFGWGGADVFVLGYAGRLVAEKGLADAVAALSQGPSQAHLVFVGDGPCRQDLIDMATSLGVSERVHFVGACPQVELPRYINSFDALVLPSRTTTTWKEQFGRVLIEAGACAVPSIGSDSGAIPDVIGEGGLTFHEGDVDDFARCVRVMVDDRALCAQYGDAAFKQAHGLYSWKQVASNMHDIYQSLESGTTTP